MNLPTWEECDIAHYARRPLNPLEKFVHDNEPAVDVEWRTDLTAAIEFAIAEHVKEQVKNVSAKLYHWDKGDGVNPATRVRREVLETVTIEGMRFHVLDNPEYKDSCINCDFNREYPGLCQRVPCTAHIREDRRNVIFKRVDASSQPRWGDRAPGGGLAP